ncbi:hypothetical protein [Salinibacillus xinjiangensis]|uniref:hypothetical protein n=1 Tax=Salinibacillus xinjiangensis TaxID=1229268 RepID=UPI001E56CE7F|nr:hypothetical protein [Salinibacillus xinjiangensis]
MVLLHHYQPNRAQLGLKTLESSLPEALVGEVMDVFQYITPTDHPIAAQLIIKRVNAEKEWMLSLLNKEDYANIQPFLEKIVTRFRS